MSQSAQDSWLVFHVEVTGLKTSDFKDVLTMNR